MRRNSLKFKLLRMMRLPHDQQNIKTTIENLTVSSEMTGVNLWVLVAAIFIASLGLNTNSTAVIIGAMLVSPLMGPIMGFGLGLGINDFGLLRKAAVSFLQAVVISIVTSVLYFSISPVREAGSELLARTSPTIYDVMIAFFGGMAGIIAGASALRRSNVIPGVAIATALMPPLCTVGYGIANFNLGYAAGAFYLFLINCVFICLSTYLVVRFLNYPKKNDSPVHLKKRLKLAATISVILLVAPSIYITYRIVKKHGLQQQAQAFIKNEVESKDHIVVSSNLKYNPRKSTLELMMMGSILDSLAQASLKEKMLQYGMKNCDLVFFQGVDSKKALKGEFDLLSTNIEIQKASVKDLYLVADSLWNEVNYSRLPDSIQSGLAKVVYSHDTTLQQLQVQRQFAFNPVKNRNDTMWTVVASFVHQRPHDNQERIDSIIHAMLKPGEVTIVYR